jgi:hypothetical protein
MADAGYEHRVPVIGDTLGLDAIFKQPSVVAPPVGGVRCCV